jgi:DNA-binding LacI/PurR family transcriptional regulator
VFQGASPIENALFVTVDNYAGGCRATQHLIDQGFHNIAHISGTLAFADAVARKSGWTDTIEKPACMPADPIGQKAIGALRVAQRQSSN